MFLELIHLSKDFGGRPVVDDFSLSLEQGELLSILGSSGCGKTTTLNMIGGFLMPDGGRILLDGEDITALSPEERPVSTVFQSYSLFPHMTVLENITYGLKFRRFSRAKAREKGMEYLELIGLSGYGAARIHELSGGQQQRVALARALIVEPKVCLLDEPFSSLDAGLRARLRLELRKIQKELGTTMVFVTHDQEEALILSDRMAIMEKGRLIQTDTPDRILDAPADPFVRRFLHMEDLVTAPDGRLMKVIRKPNR